MTCAPTDFASPNDVQRTALAPGTCSAFRRIRNRHGSGAAALAAWTRKGGCLWGEPIQLGPDKWHVYGAHRRRWRPVKVEFTAAHITILWPNEKDEPRSP